jgi:radical SAM superfamily enzyme YgiQ (UPF0313 family)
MRMLLVQPPQGSTFGLTKILTGEPLGLECVGGALRARGHDAEILDLRLDTWRALDRALSDPPAAVGVSCSFSTDVYATLEIARFVKDRWPMLPIVVGGHHASLIPQDFLFLGSGVDGVVIGEGEWTSVDLMDALRRRTTIHAVEGLLTRANQFDGFRRRPSVRSLDDLPGPDRALTANHRNRYHTGLRTHSASIETSRGCPFNCNFCSVWIFSERRAAKRSAGGIVRELEGMSEPYVFITDDIAFLDRDIYRELAERLEASGMRKMYSCETRSDLLVRHRDLLPRWRAVGLDTVFLGIEKIDDAGLASVRKRTKGGSGTNVEAIRILRGEGITPMTMFITDPGWGEEDFDRLEEFVSRLDLPNPGFSVLTPFPGTELYEARKSDLVTSDYGYFDGIHAVIPTRLPLERFYERFARLYDNVVKDTRPSFAMLWNATRLALTGGFWCMRQVYGAVQKLREPTAYLRPPVRVYAPRREHSTRRPERPSGRCSA